MTVVLDWANASPTGQAHPSSFKITLSHKRKKTATLQTFVSSSFKVEEKKLYCMEKLIFFLSTQQRMATSREEQQQRKNMCCCSFSPVIELRSSSLTANFN